jgi:hypothetical protein
LLLRKGKTNISPLSFVVVVGSGKDKSGSGSGINIPDPWF